MTTKARRKQLNQEHSKRMLKIWADRRKNGSKKAKNKTKVVDKTESNKRSEAAKAMWAARKAKATAPVQGTSALATNIVPILPASLSQVPAPLQLAEYNAVVEEVGVMNEIKPILARLSAQARTRVLLHLIHDR